MMRPDLSKNTPAPHAARAWCGKWFAIGLLSVCIVFAMSLWFSLSAVVPTLQATHGLSDVRAALLSSSVSIGFVVGTIVSATLGLADRFHPRRLFMMAALTGAAANALILVLDPGSVAAILLRLLTGASMAWIYPVGMRIAATWAAGDTGIIAAIVTSAICIGSGLPHLVDALGGLDWRLAVGSASALAAASGLMINAVRLGPSHVAIANFRTEYAAIAWRDVPIRLANIGYCGHKWENYAMWTWIGTYLLLSYQSVPGGDEAYYARIATFGVFLASAAGCIVAGFASDRAGRTLVALVALGASGLCCLLAPFVFASAPWLVTLFVLIWAFALIADSAQFSASVIELSDRAILGTMLTVQTCLGYLITMASIHLVEIAASWVGWHYALMTLAIGPAVSIVAMLRLRQRPEALRLANGRR